tara:strand:+ start:439 stop:633 length:195 start_codon:yes stop_codon:yes gene_type:complete
MKAGDLVNVVGSFGGRLYGTLVDKVAMPDWWWVMTYDGLITWPESQLEIIATSKELITKVPEND